jgi:hypothetical protein
MLRSQYLFPVLVALGCGHFDANETAIFSRSLEHVKTEVIEAEYPAFRARDYIPLESGVDAGADSFVWYYFERVGLAKMIANYATDFPYVNEYGAKNITPIESIGVGYQYNVQEVRAAGKANYQLETRRARLAREAVERLIDSVAAHGDAARNVPGLLNNANIPKITVGINGDWDGAATPAEILEDLFTMAFSVWTQSKQIHKPNIMLLGSSLYRIAASTPYSTTIPDTVLDIFLRTNPFIRRVESWIELDLADEQLDGERAVVYELSPDNLGLVLPIEFESMPPQADNLNFKVPCHARIGGTIVYRPLAFAYIDALND